VIVSSHALFVPRNVAENPSLLSEIAGFPRGKLVPTRAPDFGFNPKK
jgi:hypothetical protein